MTRGARGGVTHGHFSKIASSPPSPPIIREHPPLFPEIRKSISSAASKDETSGGVTNYFASNEGCGAAKNQKCPEIPEAKFVRMSLGTFKREGNCCRRRSEKLGARLHSKTWQRTFKVLAPSCHKLLPLEVQLSL